ncbi:MAG: pitrilysin family protein [Candidatus Eiseniibacteriota bacterium]
MSLHGGRLVVACGLLVLVLAHGAPLAASSATGAVDPGPAVDRDPGAASQPAPAALRLDVQRHRLDNGMTLLLVERHRAPVVSIVLDFKVGSVDEHAGVIGAAHFVEHMLFKGTPTVGTRDRERERTIHAAQDRVAAALTATRRLARQQARRLGAVPDSTRERLAGLGAALDSLLVEERAVTESEVIERLYERNGAVDNNAGTGYDETQYYVSLPANRLELWARLLAEQMESPVFREFYAERDVIIEERHRSVDTQPDLTLYEQVIGTAFLAHPYQIMWEWESEVEHITRQELYDFFRRYYAPNRAVLAIVGDVEPVATIALIERYFGGIPAQPEPEPVVVEEPVQRGERRLVVDFDAEPRLLMAWHKGAYDDPDEATFRVIQQILSGGRTSRFHRHLIEGQRVARTVVVDRFPSSGLLGPLYPELFMVYAEPRAPHTLAELEHAIDLEVARLANEPVEATVLDRARNMIEADFVRGLESHMGLAWQLAAFEAVTGDWRELERAVARVREVTAEDIMRVARTTLVPRNRTVGYLVRPDSVGAGAVLTAGGVGADGPAGAAGGAAGDAP